MPRLTDAVRNDRMIRIADAALRCYGRDGFAGTSMADIIAESGLSAGSIYSHFTGKADLARFAAESLLEARRRALEEMTAGGATPGPGEILGFLFTEMTRAGATSVLLQVWAEAPHDPELAARVQEKIAEVRTLIGTALHGWAAQQEGDSDQRANDAADTVMLLFQGLAVRLSLQPTLDPEAMLRAVSAVLD